MYSASSHRPGDRQGTAGFYDVWKRGQTHWQIGDNTNLFDWTYVGNVAHAHLLAADKLDQPSPAETKTPEELADLAASYLPPVTLTTGTHRIPTSEARPLGPCVEPPADAAEIEARWRDPNYTPSSARVTRKSRFDQFSEGALSLAPTSPFQVAGQAFFITNGEPVYFWDYARSIFYRFDKHYGTEKYKKKPIVMSNTIGLVLAHAAEWWGWLTGKQPAFTVYRVKLVCKHKWHNIEKARRVLGYEPIVDLDEGMQRTVDVSVVSPLSGRVAHPSLQAYVQWIDANPTKA